MMIRFEVQITNKVRERILTSADKLRAAVVRKSWTLVLELEAYVKTHKLSGDPLRVQTGNLRRSIRSTVEDKGDVVEARVFSDGSVPYANIHEYGGTTAPHDIWPVKKQALHFMMQGKEVFARHVRHPGSKIPERSYLRSSLGEMSSHIHDEYANILSEEDL